MVKACEVKKRLRTTILLVVFNTCFLPLLLAAPEVPVPASAEPVFRELERHYAVILQGTERVGKAMDINWQSGEGDAAQYKTEEIVTLLIRRGPSVIEVTSTSTIVEDARGLPLSFKMSTVAGQSVQEMRGERQGKQFAVVTRGNQQMMAAVEGAIGPAMSERMIREIAKKTGEKTTLTEFVSSAPHIPNTVVLKAMGKDSKTLLGKEQSLWRVEEQTSLFPGESIILWLDDDGKLSAQEMPIPGLGKVLFVDVKEEEWKKAVNPIEVFISSLIKPTGVSGEWYNATRAVMKLSLPEGKKITLWSGEGQTVHITANPNISELVNEKQTWKPEDFQKPPPFEATEETKEFLASSSVIEASDPSIISLAQKAVGEEKNPVLAARKIELFVRQYVKDKNLDSVFATAKETAASRSGDCSEHAVLAVALCRAVGLPARIVVGLVHAPVSGPAAKDFPSGIFGFHMWGEALVSPGQWMPVDAAQPVFTVSHIAIDKTALSGPNPSFDLVLRCFQMMQNLKIEVVELK